MVKQKGFYTYDYMRNFEKFKEELPSKEKFYSSLSCKKSSYNEYEHVLKVWNKFEMKTITGYHDLYLKCDVLLLADFFEKFRNNSLKIMDYVPVIYLNSSALSCVAMLFMAKVELELIPDDDIHSFKKV